MTTPTSAPTLWTIGTAPWLPEPPRPLLRVIVDNDFAGDPDDLYQLAHQLLSPGAEVRGIVCSHLAAGDPFHPGPDSADQARRVVEQLATTMAVDLADRVYTGSNQALTSATEPLASEAARFIVAEAMRTEPDLGRLFVVCGGGLTDLASAWLLEPRIAERITVIWIGGPEHEGLGQRPPGGSELEYNLAIDPIAGQVVLNDSDLDLWLVPRNLYRQCLVSEVELRARVAPCGELGAHLYQSISQLRQRLGEVGLRSGESYALGDSPLVLLTALQSFFEPDPSSSDYVLLPCPRLDPRGRFIDRPEGRPVRVYTRLDVRLMFEDMYLKFAELAIWLATQRDPD